MQIEFIIEDSDFLTFQLHTASESPLVRRKRLRNKILIPVIYTIFGLLFIYYQQYYITITFVVLSVMWFIFYPLYEKQRYIKYFRNFIQENYQQRFDRLSHLNIDPDFITAHDNANESKVMTSEIERIIEIPDAIYIKLKTGPSYILPKRKISNIEEVILGLKSLAQTLNIEYRSNLTWYWK